MPEGRQAIYPIPWQCTLFHAQSNTKATPEGCQRDVRSTPRYKSDPLAVQIIPHLTCKSNEFQAPPKRRQRDAKPYIRSLSSVHCSTLKATPKRRQRDVRGTPEARHGVNPTPWQCKLFHACHAKASEPKGQQNDIKPYIRPLSSKYYSTPATQKQRSSKNTKAISQEHQSDAKGTPRCISDPLALHIQRDAKGMPYTPESLAIHIVSSHLARKCIAEHNK